MRSRQCLRKSARQRHRSPCPSPKRLVGWARVALQPGEARTVSVAVPAQHFAVWMRMRTHGGSARAAPCCRRPLRRAIRRRCRRR
ncbi:fibronectin type III-like domain-contianing protein [Burkholderia arboris]|nr:fibronectin type III-like domain-contianing protein [Burkholderia arboris]MCA8492917.1 fibronectin type III-like domain-contianing protein [Burkholderia arboris]UTV54025.1 fibronectin type III-like domain-contianing protein [Burkholderia arboris]